MGCSYEEYQDLEDSLIKERGGNEWLSEELTRVRNELDQANETIKDLRSQLQEAMSSTGTGTGTGADFIQELEQLDKLQLALEEVRVAINHKTDAFTLEGSTVIGVVAREIDALADLQQAVDRVTESAGKKTEAMSKADTISVAEATPVIDDQVLAVEEKHNAELQEKAELYQKLISSIKEAIDLQKIINSGNIDILPKYDYDGSLLPADGYSSWFISKTNNRITKKHIKNTIGYLDAVWDNDTNPYLESEKNALAAMIATYQDLDEAKKIFLKRELYIWDEVIKRIAAAKAAKEAYDKVDSNYNDIEKTARQLGDSNTTVSGLDVRALYSSFIDNGDVEGALGFLTEKYKIELEPEIKSGAVLDEVQDNVKSTPATIEVKADTEQAKKAIEDVKQEKKETEQTEFLMFDGEIEKLKTLKNELKKLGDSINSYSTTLSEKFNVELTALEQRIGDITKKINDAVEVLTGMSPSTGVDSLYKTAQISTLQEFLSSSVRTSSGMSDKDAEDYWRKAKYQKDVTF